MLDHSNLKGTPDQHHQQVTKSTKDTQQQGHGHTQCDPAPLSTAEQSLSITDIKDPKPAQNLQDPNESAAVSTELTPDLAKMEVLPSPPPSEERALLASDAGQTASILPANIDDKQPPWTALNRHDFASPKSPYGSMSPTTPSPTSEEPLPSVSSTIYDSDDARSASSVPMWEKVSANQYNLYPEEDIATVPLLSPQAVKTMQKPEAAVHDLNLSSPIQIPKEKPSMNPNSFGPPQKETPWSPLATMNDSSKTMSGKTHLAVDYESQIEDYFSDRIEDLSLDEEMEAEIRREFYTDSDSDYEGEDFSFESCSSFSAQVGSTSADRLNWQRKITSVDVRRSATPSPHCSPDSRSQQALKATVQPALPSDTSPTKAGKQRAISPLPQSGTKCLETKRHARKRRLVFDPDDRVCSSIVFYAIFDAYLYAAPIPQAVQARHGQDKRGRVKLYNFLWNVRQILALRLVSKKWYRFVQEEAFHQCLMEGHRGEEDLDASEGKILPHAHSPKEMHRNVWIPNECADCRSEAFLERFKELSVHLLWRYCDQYREMTGYQDFVEYGYKSDANVAAHQVVKELKEVMKQDQERDSCKCRICERQKRLRDDQQDTESAFGAVGRNGGGGDKRMKRS
ncbi:unnamed protein product [Sympodiomycopsis kandeliae]